MQNNEVSQEIFQKTNTVKVEKKDSAMWAIPGQRKYRTDQKNSNIVPVLH